MSTTISVNKQSVEQLLSAGKDKPFVIPEYQRPYAWSDEQVETLFNDLWEFANTEGGTERDATYFLGSIVSYENDKNEQEIIDGQQRVTSLFLLLRAIYTKLMIPEIKTEEAENFIRKIEPTIWRANKLTGKVDYSNILLHSRVINNEGNEILRKILETGKADPKADDNYSKNYIKFQDMFDRASAENPLMVYQFVYALLNQAILLPICADNSNTALTIFSTLNDRGLPLSDADIFKAEIYKHLPLDEKSKFIDAWRELDENAAYVSESIQQLFYYYMFYLRALSNDRNSTTPGIRKYYLSNNHSKLYEKNLLKNLATILNIWKVVTLKETIADEKWSSNTDIRKSLDILSSYPNEYWKYPVVIYYLIYKDKDGFEDKYLIFLRKLIVELLEKYLTNPTVNAVKSDILKLNAEIIFSDCPKFDFNTAEKDIIAEKIKIPHKSVVRMILKLLAYNHQEKLLPYKWEIEHILPQKWQNNYFMNMSDEAVKAHIEHIGNKIPFEKKLNIVAGNGYFRKKKEYYYKSDIEITKIFSQINSEEWKIENIIERDIRVSDEVITILHQWSEDYIMASNRYFQ